MAAVSRRVRRLWWRRQAPDLLDKHGDYLRDGNGETAAVVSLPIVAATLERRVGRRARAFEVVDLGEDHGLGERCEPNERRGGAVHFGGAWNACYRDIDDPLTAEHVETTDQQSNAWRSGRAKRP